MAMVDVGHIAAYTGGLAAQFGRPDLRVGSRVTLTYIRQMNTVPCIIIIIIIIIINSRFIGAMGFYRTLRISHKLTNPYPNPTVV